MAFFIENSIVHSRPDDIDEILNRHNQNCIASIEALFAQTKSNNNVLKFLQKVE